MNASRLLEHFDRISEAPDAVRRLRRFVLDLAVRGKLVEQDPKDEPSVELLKRIQAEKTRLVRDGQVQATRPPVPASADELSLELPPGWAPAKVSQILVEIQTGPFGSTLHQSDYQAGGVPVINPASIKAERLIPIDGMAVGPDTVTRLETFKLRARDVVMARRGEMGRCAVVTDAEAGWLCGTGSLILRLPSCMFPAFFVTLIGSPFVREYLGGSAVGSTMQNLNQSILLSLVVGLPPLAEQHRIVAKVDELMALCDRLAAAQAERERRRDRLVASSLNRLNQSADAGSFRESARFNLAHLPCLTSGPHGIMALRDAILDLAVQGRLVAQSPDDEPANELLNRISGRQAAKTASHRERLDESFTVPSTWRWAELGDVVESMSNGVYKPAKFYSKTGTACVRMFNIQDGRLDLTTLKRLDLSPGEVDRYRLDVGDLLVNRVNSRELVGKCAVVEASEEPLVFEAMNIRVRLVERQDLPRYVNIFLRTTRVRDLFLSASKQAVGQASINQPQVAGIAIPIPPLAEQRRIVARVDELVALCDRLDVLLMTAQTENRGLLEAVIHDSLALAD